MIRRIINVEVKMFRLHIDVPLGYDEAEAIRLSSIIMDFLKNTDFKGVNDISDKRVGFRLANDEDRAKRNYLVKDENGKCTTKKIEL